ncbi:MULTISPECIES: trigger factor [unclassified Meiothermus]|uniref:trigger factor n=1 Tax=unclassified Meiothermus TaxID=370471 RepID=UPI000D7C2472|nr:MULTISPECIES: trigger factor [unclassified Meiothermus]PZA07742.1 trigger factor [Meiothermus sp. Pnk-1]RYM35353.1 trigger factor [Meiothermus sp. PNK-Is4]
MAEILEREGYRVKLKVEVPAAEVNKAYDAVLREYASKVRVPGFRPGKAPTKVIEARLGRESLLEEVKERLLDASYPEAVKELELFPVGVKLLEAHLEQGQPFTYVAEVENYPEVKLPNWREFKLEVPPVEITDEMVEQALQELRQRYGELVPVERPIEAKDQVFIETEDGARFPVDMEKALEHVREALLGKAAGDEVMVPVKDGDAVVKELKTKILEVKALQLPELDDEFAKTVGEESLEGLRGKVRLSLEAQAARTVQEAKAEQLLEKLAEGLEAEIPPTMLNREQQHLLEHMAEDLQKEKTTLQDYLKKLEDEGKLEEFRADLKASAEKRIRRALAKERLQEELGTELTEEEWNAYLSDMARAYRTNVASLKKELGEETLERLRVQRTQDKALAEALQKLE